MIDFFQAGRWDVLYWIKANKLEKKESSKLVVNFFKNIYANYLMLTPVRLAVLVVGIFIEIF